MLEKTNEDLKYMNGILKQDIMKIKEISGKDWEK
jgi:hypothetical protein